MLPAPCFNPPNHHPVILSETLLASWCLEAASSLLRKSRGRAGQDCAGGQGAATAAMPKRIAKEAQRRPTDARAARPEGCGAFPGGVRWTTADRPLWGMPLSSAYPGGKSAATLRAGRSCIRRAALHLLGDALGHRRRRRALPGCTIHGRGKGRFMFMGTTVAFCCPRSTPRRGSPSRSFGGGMVCDFFTGVPPLGMANSSAAAICPAVEVAAAGKLEGGRIYMSRPFRARVVGGR